MTTQAGSLREALVSLAKSEMADLGRLMEEAIAAGDRDTILAAVARHVDARGRALESIRNLLALDLAELRTGGGP